MPNTRISKFLSYVLRHRPDAVGITLDAQGWVAIDLLLAAAAAHGTCISRDDLDDIVRNNPKQRFAISDDGTMVRASQGHSIAVELGYTPATPPAVLYHGTADRNLAAIRAEGLLKGRRHHVHLSIDPATAAQVGGRHGRPAVLIVRAAEMHAAGYTFHLSANGVWLTEHVPASFSISGCAITHWTPGKCRAVRPLVRYGLDPEPHRDPGRFPTVGVRPSPRSQAR